VHLRIRWLSLGVTLAALMVALVVGVGVRLHVGTGAAEAAVVPPPERDLSTLPSAVVPDRVPADVTAPAALDSATPMFVKFDGIDGEADDKDHTGWSDMLGFRHEITRNESGESGSVRARSVAELGPLVVAKSIDKAAPKLQEAILQGRVFPMVRIELGATYTDAGRVVYYRYELKNVQITSYNISGDTDSLPVEELALSFEEIKVTYTEYDNTGKKKGSTEYDWKQ